MKFPEFYIYKTLPGWMWLTICSKWYMVALLSSRQHTRSRCNTFELHLTQLKRIAQRDLTWVEARLKRYVLLSYRVSKFSFWILKGHHHEKNIKPVSGKKNQKTLSCVWEEIFQFYFALFCVNFVFTFRTDCRPELGWGENKIGMCNLQCKSRNVQDNFTKFSSLLLDCMHV